MSMDYDEMIAVIQAAKEGKQIQRICRFGGINACWEPHESNWRFDFAEYTYRIKREPKVVWVNESGDNRPVKDVVGLAYESPEKAKEFASPFATRFAVRYREWPEGEG